MEEEFVDGMDDGLAFTVSELRREDPPPEKTEPKLIDYIEYRTYLALMIYVSPVILVFGTIGNVTSFAVLRTRAFRGCAAAFTLSALAVVDTSVLWTSLLRQWILRQPGGIDVRTIFWSVGCKVHMAMTYYLQQLSSWTLVIVTMERCCCVCLPLLSRRLCTRSRMRRVWFVAVCVLLSVNAHFLWTADYGLQRPSENVNETSLICHIAPRFHWFFSVVWYWLDFVLASAVPFLCILTGNTLIAAFLIRGAKRRRRDLQATTDRAAASSSGKPSVIPKYSSAASMTSSTAMLMGISVVFLVTTTPYVVYFLRVEHWMLDTSVARTARIYLAFSVTNLLYYANNACNFILYCLTGSRFRQALVACFRCRAETTASRNNDVRSNVAESMPTTNAHSYSVALRRK